ncbi:MAG: hypothetical protein VKJ66_09700 [Synechococcus sp.]|nr:hypothetical protein [Synechococcus sp.]
MHQRKRGWPRLFAAAAALLLLLASPRIAAASGAEDTARYLCAGEPLLAEVHQGAVDAPVPNTLAGTVPGAFVVLRWGERTLQLPRTNNAGAPSYTDGLWWWSAADPLHPRFEQNRGEVIEIQCEPL